MKSESLILSVLRHFSQQWRKCLNENPDAMQAESLRSMNAQYCCIEEFVLDHGQQFDASTRHPLSKRHRLGHCYENAWNFIGERCNPVIHVPTKYTYVEGYAVEASRPFAFLHGWVVTNDGQVIDPTWGWAPDVEYFGIPFDWRFFNRTIVKSNTIGLLEPFHVPILKGTWKYVRAAKFRRKTATSLPKLEVAL